MQRATDRAGVTVPTVHLNGTGRDALSRQYRDAAEAIQAAIIAHADAAPHGRDYYPQGGDAYRQASREHGERDARLRAVLAEVDAMWEHIEGLCR